MKVRGFRLDILTKLLILEQNLEKLYIALAYLEISGEINSDVYKLNMQKINELTKQEGVLLASLNDSYNNAKMNVEALLKKMFDINLGYNDEAYLIRVNKLLESICGDSGIEYADALYYDIHKIILTFLDYMIDKPYYEDIRQDLIFYKYDIIFLDYNIESDFLIQLEENKVSLNSKRLRNSLPCSKYIEKAILVTDILEYLKQIELAFDLNEKNSSYVLVVMRILQIFARISLCDEELLKYVMDDINNLLENDDVNETVKEIIIQVLEMFRQIKDNFYFTR